MNIIKDAAIISLIIWFIMNISTLLLNKYIFASLGFIFPFALSAIHMVVCAIGARVSVHQIGMIDLGEPISIGDQIRRILPLALLFSSNIVLGNVSLRFVPVSFMQTIKASVPLFTVTLQTVLFKKQFSRPIYFAMVPIVGGVALASLSEVNYNHKGFYSALASSIITALFAIISGVMLQQKLNPITLLYYMAPWSALLLLPLSLLLESQQIIQYISDISDNSLLPVITILLISGTIAFMLNISTFFVIKSTSALTYTVSGNLKVILSIGISILVFKNEVGLLNAIGCAIAIIGVAWYGQESSKPSTNPILISNINDLKIDLINDNNSINHKDISSKK